jgi:hypothetical protein
VAAPGNKSFLVLFFKKEQDLLLSYEKKQKDFYPRPSPAREAKRPARVRFPRALPEPALRG